MPKRLNNIYKSIRCDNQISFSDAHLKEHTLPILPGNLRKIMTSKSTSFLYLEESCDGKGCKAAVDICNQVL